MMFKAITTMDPDISFINCEIREPSDEIKKLLPDENFVEVIEKGKSYILNTNYIVMLFR